MKNDKICVSLKPKPMLNITLDHLQPHTAEQLRQRAAQNGHSIEDEITEILESVLTRNSSASSDQDIVASIQKRFANIEDFDIPELPRESIRTPPTF